MKVNLQEVQQLKAKLNAMLLKNENVLSHSDKETMQHINNIEHYLLSSSNYDASFQIGMLKELVEDCSPRVAEQLRSFLADS